MGSYQEELRRLKEKLMAIYTVTTFDVVVLGRGWYGQKMCYRYKLSSYDRENIGELNRESVQDWLDSHAGDFQVIDDFAASLGILEIPWEREESEMEYCDMMYGAE